MLKKLRADRTKVPSPSRNEILTLMEAALGKVDLDVEKAFKQLFLTNAWDGTEDFLVLDRLFIEVGEEIIKFRDELKATEPPDSLEKLLTTLTPPKGVKRGGKMIYTGEGSELLDGEKMTEIEENLPLIDDSDNDFDILRPPAPAVTTTTTTLNADKTVSMEDISDDPDINMDAKILDELKNVLATNKSSISFLPIISQIRVALSKGSQCVKKRHFVNEKKKKLAAAKSQENEADKTGISAANACLADLEVSDSEMADVDESSEMSTSSVQV